MTTIGSTFSGCDGLALGLSRALGAEVRWHAEVDPDANKVLAHRWPGVPNLGSVGDVDWSQVEPVDVLCGGPPCQAISWAGLRKGEADDRWQWPAFLRAVRLARPRWVVAENPSALLGFDDGRSFGGILAGLAEAGYDTWWRCIRASDVGAPHRRERVFLLGALADADRFGIGSDGTHSLDAAGTGASSGAVGCRAGTTSADALGHVLPRTGPGGAAADATDERRQRERGARGRGTGPADGGAAAADADLGGRTWGEPVPGRGTGRRDAAAGPGADVRVDWGAYSPAIAQWSRLFRPAPHPVDGRGRLSPEFVGWMMGCPDGWVDVPGVSRSAQLRILGNSVQVQVAEAVGLWVAALDGERVAA